MKNKRKTLFKSCLRKLLEERRYLSTVYGNNFEMNLKGNQADELTYKIDEYFDKASVTFLSEWFFDEKIHNFTSFKKKPLKINPVIPTQYAFPDTNLQLNTLIENFHIQEGLPRGSFVAFISEGSTPIIAAITLFAKKMGFDEILSVFPLYFTIHKMCGILNTKISPCNDSLTYQDGIGLHLPKKKSFLFITDPIWSIGRHHSQLIFKQLAEWQKKTGSIIFVDASFSYMDWIEPIKKEPATIFDPELTFRLICPTKSLCLHGIRFSYLLCPAKFSKEIAQILNSSIGSSCYYSHFFRKRLFLEMIKNKPNPVGVFASQRYHILEKFLSMNNIDHIKPTCGFFMYADLDQFLRKKGIRHHYYWLKNEALDIWDMKYKNFAKINLIAREETFNSLIKGISI